LLDRDLPALLAAIDSENNAKRLFGALLDHCDVLLEAPSVNCTRSGVENSLLSQARAVLDITYSLGLAHRVLRANGSSSNVTTSYATRVISELLHVASDDCPDWNPSHFLDVAEMTHAVAIGYDWLYDSIQPADRSKIETGAMSKGLLAGLTQYTWQKPAWWHLTTTNWNLVCNGGLLVGALSFATSSTSITNRTHEYNASALSDEVFEYAMSGLPHAFNAYGPDGGWSEGQSI
jgi:hypothetical protein